MPAFDPVRDAVLNSPTSPIQPLISPSHGRRDVFTSPHSDAFHTPVITSPTLGRRATDLAVLLNEISQPPAVRSPAFGSASALSHLLIPQETIDDKLAHAEPLRRPSIGEPTQRSWSPRFSRQPEPSISRQSLSHHVPPSIPLQPSQSPAGSSSSKTLPSPEHLSVHLSFSRPPSSSSSSPPATFTTPPIMSPPRPPPTTRPYNPTRRTTPAKSVLQPMSQGEIEMYKTYVGTGTQRLAKRKRGPSSEPDIEIRPSKKHVGDTGVVAMHYNARPDVGVIQRRESPILGLKNFNNWIKSVLISRFAHPAIAKSPSRNATHATPSGSRSAGGVGKVLEIGIGKGGDLNKWAKARIRELVGADIAAVSVEQARTRWESIRHHRFDATFVALDCYTESLARAVQPAKLAQPFDVVSMQFCMHYAFESVQKVRCMLDNVTRWLRPGGVFIGTVPNADILLRRLDALPADATELSFGNSVYKVRFEDRVHKSVFGQRYWFYLQDAVEDVPEYIVLWDNFVQLAAEHRLYPIYKKGFHQMFEEHRKDPAFGQLMHHMKVVDAKGESVMDEDQWEAANIYIAFAFEKR